MYKIFIVEDDKTIANALKEHLSMWEYQVETVKDFKAVMNQFAAFEPHVVLMDIGLPFFNGYHWCREIRKISDVPVVFLSSASENMNIVMAMNMGGDDFIVKPFDLEVLTAKLQAVLRRSYSGQSQGGLLEHNGLILNMGDATLVKGNVKVELTKNDYRIMEILMRNAGKVVSREAIIQKLWESEEFIDDNTLTVNVTRLRKKLEQTGSDEIIKTKKGLGYIIE